MIDLTEDQVIEAFHSMLKDSLAQARADGLLLEADLLGGSVRIQIAGPSLCLYYAALGADGDPPYIQGPDGAYTLTVDNCPRSFLSFFRVWQRAVRPLRSLSTQNRHDVALVLCEKEPIASPIDIASIRLAQDLRAVAIEIVQRRTFQVRFGGDLQHVLDSSGRMRLANMPSETEYEPPPQYDAADSSDHLSAQSISARAVAPPPRNTELDDEEQPLSTEHLESLNTIRETLYAALADCMVTNTSMRSLLSRGPGWASRAYFAALSLAILDVAVTCVTEHGIRSVHFGRNAASRFITRDACPPYLQPFFTQLSRLSTVVQRIAQEDDRVAIQSIVQQQDMVTPQLERLRERLEMGVGDGDARGRDTSPNGSVANIANAINALANAVFSLPGFEQRQAEAFQILASVTSL